MLPAFAPPPAGLTGDRTAPTGLLEAGAGLGVNLALPGPLFLELAVDGGVRITHLAHVGAGKPTSWAVAPVASGRAALGIELGFFELAATGSLSRPFGEAAPAGDRFPGFGQLVQAGVHVGAAF